MYRNPWLEQRFLRWEDRVPRRSLLNGFASLLLPGLGQLSASRLDASVSYLFLTFSAYLVFVPLGIIIHIACAFDAYLYGPEYPLTVLRSKRKKPFAGGTQTIASLMSFLVPGLGHLASGRVTSGLVWMIIVCLGYVAFIVPGIILHILCVIDASLADIDA